MPLSRRFHPEHSPGDTLRYGIDFSHLTPVKLTAGSVSVWHNVVPPVATPTDFTVGAVEVDGRVAWAQFQGGVDGRDYQLRFQVTDDWGQVFRRTALLLVAETS